RAPPLALPPLAAIPTALAAITIPVAPATRAPIARAAIPVAARPAGLARLTPLALALFPALGLGQERLAAQAHAPVAVDVGDHDLDLVAEAHHVFGLLHAIPREVRDVTEAVGARHDLEERAVVLDAPDGALVGLADLRLLGEAADDVERLGDRRRVGRRHVHG